MAHCIEIVAALCAAITVTDNFSKEDHFKRKDLSSGCLNKTDLVITEGSEGSMVYNAFVRLRQMFNRDF